MRGPLCGEPSDNHLLLNTGIYAFGRDLIERNQTIKRSCCLDVGNCVAKARSRMLQVQSTLLLGPAPTMVLVVITPYSNRGLYQVLHDVVT